MPTPSERLKADMHSYAEMIMELGKGQAVITALNLDEIVLDTEYTSYSNYAGFIIHAKSFERAGEIARQLLPIVHKFDKKFDDYSKSIELVTKFNEIKITIISAPSDACKIEVVEEEVTEPARTYTKRRYVLSGDCNPVLESKQEPEPEVVNATDSN